MDGRRGQYRTESDLIDLGNEPPLSVDGGEDGVIDRRRVSVQWFSGTILTGLCGAALMGGAVFTSLDGEAHFAALPERVESALRGAIGSIGERLTGLRKADRLPPPGESSGARQVIRVSMTSRSGNREIVRVRPFVRVSANLSMSLSELSANIPPFNPQKLLADSGDTPDATAAAAAPGASAEPDAEVSFVMRDLGPLMPRLKVASTTSIDDVMTRVREIAGPSAAPKTSYAVAGIEPTGQLAYAPENGADPYRGFEARIVPENITLLPKSSNQTTGGNSWNERTVTAKKNDSITTILRDLGATPEEAKAIAATLGLRGRDGALKEGNKVRVLLSAMPGSPRQQAVRVIVANESAVEAVVALSDVGKYVAVDVSTINNTEVADSSDEDDDGSGVRLYQSIYETALRNQIPRSVIDDMIRIYSYDVDFQRKAAPGDAFDVLYAGEEEGSGGDRNSEVLFASLNVGGEMKKFYRYQTLDDGVVDYYDETGKSAKKFLVRKPVSDGIMRSSFGVRRHPILGYTKMHTGVDWAAPTGTPIFASGNGVVEKVGWESGYGKYVRLRHANGYETAYGHMTAFARNMDVGTHVRQGQVIGFVGSTGLSTGAHVHYEILVNGRFVDPMRIKLPRGRSLEGAMLASFEQERDRLDGMMSGKPARVAQSGR
ncbi:MAG TPA: M23 family metallopeptidase [Pseudorhodoplanes sp.]|nr:M23 family metallopeptidase [Pseudorhodoplanes sp.]